MKIYRKDWTATAVRILYKTTLVFFYHDINSSEKRWYLQYATSQDILVSPPPALSQKGKHGPNDDALKKRKETKKNNKKWYLGRRPDKLFKDGTQAAANAVKPRSASAK
jgi:hypothetical protein